MATPKQKRQARNLAKAEGIGYMQALNRIRPPRTHHQAAWDELTKLARQNAMEAVEQGNRVFLLSREEYDGGYDEYDEYDLETHTSFPNTEDGLESAIAWLEGEYSDSEEDEEGD